VRFKNQGLDTIEVQDNGDGISPHNYDTIALKHYTSKLSTYADLTTLQTFGFRGEALSSLCALSKFSIITCMAEDAPKGTKLEFETSGALKGTGIVAAQKGTTVLVEDLFNNLPVRRRELERNIKREWNRVVGVLGQYACIQTGIKFSVTQQHTKGKKTALFSTKGNQTTRENIVNVFGAKTLTALVPLDLNLELEPTSAPSQRWSTQEDGGKKDIRIVGHISRPASGEGRQTPDRQMFFVNARPCGLPQVAKAFNEVYKSYNASQSPFIFANIELDTHLYDVNVSPDKRTILLHDQARMLENLKTSLTALFESQDYTVPISQLPAQKQLSFKQLTISRENSARAQTPKTPKTIIAPAESTDVDASEDDSRTSRRECSEEKDSQKSRSSKSKASTVSRDSMSRDREAVGLISDWVGRKVESRAKQKTQEPTAPREAANEASEGLSKDKTALVKKLRRESEQRENSRHSSEDPGGSVPTSQASHTPSPDEQVSPNPDVSGEVAEPHEENTDEHISNLERLESPIPALRTPSKLSSAVSNTFSSSARSQRAPAAVATITIGDHIVTSPIGRPWPKRPRLDSVSSTARHMRPSKVSASQLPSFGNRLSQRFAAPGTAPQPASNEEDAESETQDEPRSPQLSEGRDQSEDAELAAEAKADGTIATQADAEEEPGTSQRDQDVNSDGEYIDDDEKKVREDAKVQEMIKAAEEGAAQPSQENFLRAKALLKGGSKKKDATLNLVQVLDTNMLKIAEQIQSLDESLAYDQSTAVNTQDEALDSEGAEEKLSLTISKSDFAKMKIIGQFNLGFILASRAAEPETEGDVPTGDELFIIDQHASDEKYNFERLQATTIVQSQRLVYPKTLELTAMEEEIVMENLPALETNGFVVTVDQSGEVPVGQRCQLVSLPLSRETTFTVTDLDELLALLIEQPPGTVPRPSKVRKMFAMRACRSSVMIGKTLTKPQMGKLVSHLGELDKPWNCPHGRPTMRHLCGLGVWDQLGWKEGDGPEGEDTGETDWAFYVRQSRGGSASP